MIYGTLGFLFVVIGTGIYQTHFSYQVQTYTSFEHSLYHVSNQCIFDYYANDLTTEGFIFSHYSIIEDCDADHISDSTIKIYDTDGKQESAVNAYKLHGLMLDVGANGCFMNRIILRRIDNDDFVQDLTEMMRERRPEDDNITDLSFDQDLEV
jgi:hypothetical protein